MRRAATVWGLLWIAVCVVSGCGGGPAGRLVGDWVIDAEGTQEAVKQSPKWQRMSEREREVLPKMIGTLLGDMKMSFTPDSVTTTARGKSDTATYQVASTSRGEVVLTSNMKGRDVSLTVSFPSRDRLRLKSDATDDMDFLVWKRAK